MSIYSGFATRQQEEQYDQIISNILYILQKRICKFYLNEPANDIKFIELLTKLYLNSKNMEQSKYLQPKFSKSITQLIDMLKDKRKKYQDEGMKMSIISSEIKQKEINNSQQKTKPPHKQQSNPQTAPHKFVTTQKIPIKNLQKSLLSQMRSNLVKKHAKSNNNYKSVLIEVNSQSDMKNKLKQSNKPDIVFFRTPNRQQIITFYNEKTFQQQSRIQNNKKLKYSLQKQKQQLKNNRKQNKLQHKKQRAHASSYHKFQLNQQKYKQLQYRAQSKEDVRQLIKGYLVKKKKNQINEQQKRKQQIYQIFKD